MNNLYFMLTAAANTVALSLLSLFFGLILALVFLAIESVRSKLISGFGIALVTIIRGLPELLLILFVYNVIPWLMMLLADGIDLRWTGLDLIIQMNLDPSAISPFVCGVIALSLLYGAYGAQALRGGLKAVSYGQWEAGLALGLSEIRVFFRIILPQMWRHALPSLGNQWLILLKDTALVSLISVNEIMLQSKSIIVRTHEPFTWYLYAAALYLLISLISQYLIKLLELRFTRFERSAN